MIRCVGVFVGRLTSAFSKHRAPAKEAQPFPLYFPFHVIFNKRLGFCFRHGGRRERAHPVCVCVCGGGGGAARAAEFQAAGGGTFPFLRKEQEQEEGEEGEGEEKKGRYSRRPSEQPSSRRRGGEIVFFSFSARKGKGGKGRRERQSAANSVPVRTHSHAGPNRRLVFLVKLTPLSICAED